MKNLICHIFQRIITNIDPNPLPYPTRILLAPSSKVLMSFILVIFQFITDISICYIYYVYYYFLVYILLFSLQHLHKKSARSLNYLSSNAYLTSVPQKKIEDKFDKQGQKLVITKRIIIT